MNYCELLHFLAQEMKEAAERKLLQVEVEENIRITETEETIEAELIPVIEEPKLTVKIHDGKKLFYLRKINVRIIHGSNGLLKLDYAAFCQLFTVFAVFTVKLYIDMANRYLYFAVVKENF